MTSNQTPNWGQYRLSDFFHFEEGERRHEEFPNTIIYEYYKRTSEQSDYKTLCEVMDHVQSIRRIAPPETDRCVIHLRTGDVIDNSEFTVDQLLEEQRYYQYDHDKEDYIRKPYNAYVKPMSYYEKVARELQRLDIKAVSFSFKLDFNPFPIGTRRKIYQRSESTEKSSEYVQRIKGFFLENSFDIINYEGRDIDYDFVYMCNSSFFVPGGGGLSRTVSKVVELKGKTVVSDQSTP